MSIVTDALNRLQSARTNLTRPAAAHDPVLGQSQDQSPTDDTEVSAGAEKPTRDMKFITVSLGGFLVVAAMALGAYWWGESLVLDLPQSVPHKNLTAKLPSKDTAKQQPNSASVPQNNLPKIQQSEGGSIEG